MKQKVVPDSIPSPVFLVPDPVSVSTYLISWPGYYTFGETSSPTSLGFNCLKFRGVITPIPRSNKSMKKVIKILPKIWFTGIGYIP